MNVKASPLPLVSFLLSVIVFGALSVYAYNGHGPTLLRWALPFEYIVLAAAAVWYLKSGSQETASFPSFKPLALGAAAASVLVAAGIGFSFKPTTMLPDESSYRFQGRLYAAGRLMAEPLPGAAKTNPQTPHYLYFEHHVLAPTGWYSKYPPGWPLVLALGYLLHADWLMNPLLGLLLLYVSAQIALAFFDDRVRWLTVLLMAISPYFFTQAYTELSHMLCAVLTAGATLLLIRWIERQKLVFLIAALVCIGINFQVRPFSALVVAVGLSIGLLYQHRFQRRLLLIDLLVLLIGGVLTVAAFLGYQYLYTGHPFLSPYAVSNGRQTPGEMVFGSKYLINGLLRLRPQMQDTLRAVFPCFGWLLVVGMLNRSRRRSKLPDFARAVMLLYPLFMLFHLNEPEPSWGANGERYYFEAYFAMAILAARGIEELVLRWNAPARRVLVATLACVAVMIPILAGSALEPLSVTLPYHRMSIALRPLLNAQTHDDIVFLTSSLRFKSHFFNINAADWRSAPVVVLGDPGDKLREKVVRDFGRTHWWVAHYDQDRNEAVVTEGGAISGSVP